MNKWVKGILAGLGAMALSVPASAVVFVGHYDGSTYYRTDTAVQWGTGEA